MRLAELLDAGFLEERLWGCGLEEKGAAAKVALFVRAAGALISGGIVAEREARAFFGALASACCLSC